MTQLHYVDTAAHSAGHEEGSTGLSESGVRDDAISKAQNGFLEQGPDQDNKRSSSTAGGTTSAHSSSSSDAFRRGGGGGRSYAGGPPWRLSAPLKSL